MLNSRYKNDGKSIIPLKGKQKKAKREIINKFLRGEFNHVARDCVCGAEEFELLSEKDAYGLPCAVVICKQCGLIQVNPCPDKQTLNNFYQEYYNKLYDDKMAYDTAFYTMSIRGESIIEYIASITPDFNKVLEIGCNVGGILNAFKSYGCCVHGVDLEKNAVDYAKSKGISVECGSAKGIKEKYDVIVLCHVLEHFFDISEELSAIKNLLNDNGILYIEVPGIYSSLGNIQFDFLDFIEFDHLYYFSLKSLSNVMRINGFTIVKGDEPTGACIRLVVKKDKNAENQTTTNLYNETLNRLNYLEEQFQKQKLKHYIFRILKAMPMGLKLKIKNIIKTR